MSPQTFAYKPKYFDVPPDELVALMSRVGARVTPGEFIQGVIEAFHEVSNYPEATMRSRFRQSRAYRDFRTLLARAGASSKTRILAIGCGPGYGGRGPGFAADTVHDLYGADSEVERMEITPRLVENHADTARPRRTFSLVVTHSMLHYLFDLRPVCRLLDSLIEPGGRYVMANEPNTRFWQNPECLRTLQLKESADRRRKRTLRLLDVRRYWAKAVRLVGARVDSDPFAAVNRRLRARFHLGADLTPEEIMHINEPHRPDEPAGAFRLGSNGLDCDKLGEFFPQLRLELVRTSGYLGRDNPDHIEKNWRAVDRGMAERFPLDGYSFGALWWKAGS